MSIDRLKQVVIYAFMAKWDRELDVSLRDRQVYDLIRAATPAFPFGTRALLGPGIIETGDPLVVVALSDATIQNLLIENKIDFTYGRFPIGSKAMSTIKCGRLFILPAQSEFFLTCLTAMEIGRAIVEKVGRDGIDSQTLGDYMLEAMRSV